MGLFRRTLEAGVVHHPQDIAACRAHLGHDDDAVQWVACWERRTTQLLAAVSVHRATEAETRGRIPGALLAMTRRLRGLGGQPAELPAAVFRQGLVDGIALWLWDVAPAHLREAVRLGFRPWGPADADGVVPMVLISHDLHHLDIVRSPLGNVLRRSRIPLSDAGPRWYRRLAWPGGTVAGPEDRPTPQGGQQVEITEEIARTALVGLQG